MKNLYSLIALMCISMTTMLYAQQHHNAWLKSDIAIKRQSAPAAKVKPQMVLSEDFSLFKKGSENAPDSENITTNYMLNEGYTHTSGWSAYHVYQAGGACAILEYEDDWYGTSYGHISTPEMELFGEVTISFKARRAAANPDKGKLWLALCDNYTGPVDDITYDLTDKWQSFEWSSDQATFYPNNIFQFKPEEGGILIDDIVIIRKKNKTLPTIALAPTNNSETEFTAHWQPVNIATGYLFNVYYKDMPETIVEPGTVTQDFESINVLSDGQSIDNTNPGYPEGWTIDVSSNGSKDMCTKEGNYHSGKQSINLDAAGDYIISPETPAPIHSISFWVKPDNMQTEEYDYSLVGIYTKRKDKEWEHIANIPNYWMEENGGFYTIDGDAVGEGVYQVKIVCEQSILVTFAIDDITLEYATQPIAYPLIENEIVTNTYRVVSDIDPSKEHYYYVQVMEDDLLSDPTDHIWVDGLTGLQPQALPATDITQNGFTANWQQMYNAGHYKLNVSQQITTTTDNQEVLLSYEDFSKITTGTLDNPTVEYYTTYNLADYDMSEQDWLLTQPQWVNGMAGTRGTSWAGEAGLVVSPKMALHDYPIKVDVTAYNTVPGDTLWVIVIDEYNSSQAVMGKQIGFSKTQKGYTSGSVTLEGIDLGDKPRHIAFMSQSGAAFYIDEVTISAIVPHKGTSLVRPYKIMLCQDNYQTFSNLSNESSVYYYSLTAHRTKNFIEYISDASETIEVKLPTAIDSHDTDADVVYATDGTIHIIASQEGTAAIYNMMGMQAANMPISIGHNTIELPQGIYIVKTNNIIEKVIVE